MQRPFWHSLICWILVAVALTSLAVPRPGHAITLGEEEELSRQIMRIIFKRFEILPDPYVAAYVSRIGQRILAALPEQPFRYHFYVIKDDSYNAFATPAGHIFVHTGLLQAMDREEELAGILAHEIAHVYCRHISQKIELSKKVGWAQLAGMAAGVLLGAAGGAAALGGALAMGSQAAGATAQLAFSRENEMQADQVGLKLLTDAGYRSDGLVAILRKIRGKQAWGKEQIPVYMMTHPAIEDRIVYTENWVDDHTTELKNLPAADPAAFERIQTRMIGEMDNVGPELEKLAAAVQRDPADVLSRHRYGLALARVNRWDEAVAELQQALARRAFDGYLLRDLGKVLLLSGSLPQAQKALEGARLALPDDPDCLFFLGRAQQELGRADEAVVLYQAVIQRMPEYRNAYFFLGQVLGRQGAIAEAHYNLGLYHLRGFDYKTAAVQFRQALRNNPDPDRRERVEQLLQKTEAEIKAEKKALEG
ncbi:MAG: M48 family metalloprotease [Desulfobacterales bacterium]|jgi:predicted Zn-dependent protease|nr:M48 family metalloprotease [Desulfobacterales bacterium]